ncbi:unnamed protein product [Umbelopsis vinacea]
MFKRAKKELAKQAIATDVFDAAAAGSDEEEKYLGASSDSESDSEVDDKLVGGHGDSDNDDDSDDEIDLKELIRLKAGESAALDLDDEEALKKLIDEEGLADLDELDEEEFEDEGSEDESENEDQGEDQDEGKSKLAYMMEQRAQEDEEGEGEDQDSGDMVYVCQICPQRILKNERAAEVHVEGKEHKRRLRYLQKIGVQEKDEPKHKVSETKKTKKKEALTKRKEDTKEAKRLKEKERRKALKRKRWERQQAEKEASSNSSEKIPTAKGATAADKTQDRNGKAKKQKTKV